MTVSGVEQIPKDCVYLKQDRIFTIAKKFEIDFVQVMTGFAGASFFKSKPQIQGIIVHQRDHQNIIQVYIHIFTYLHTYIFIQ